MQQDGAEHDRNRSAFFCGWGINVGQGRRFGLVQALNAQGGSRDQSGKDGGMCARNGDFGREVLKRGKGRKPRQHRGTGKKIPTGSGLGFHIMVEVGGIEPPSESTPSPALHAYPGR